MDNRVIEGIEKAVIKIIGEEKLLEDCKEYCGDCIYYKDYCKEIGSYSHRRKYIHNHWIKYYREHYYLSLNSRFRVLYLKWLLKFKGRKRIINYVQNDAVLQKIIRNYRHREDVNNLIHKAIAKELIYHIHFWDSTYFHHHVIPPVRAYFIAIRKKIRNGIALTRAERTSFILLISGVIGDVEEFYQDNLLDKVYETKEYQELKAGEVKTIGDYAKIEKNERGWVFISLRY